VEELNAEDKEFDHRVKWIQRLDCLLFPFLPLARASRAQFSILVGGTLFPRYISHYPLSMIVS
jgi:hypothetical protein